MPPPLEVAPAPIAGFWRRLAAFVLDGLVIGLGGVLIGWICFDALSHMGGWERLIGLALVLGYAGVLNSRIGGGQTLGKRALGVRVIGLNGAMLSLPRTLLRQSVFAVPFFLNGAPISPDFLMSFWGVPVSLVLFGGMGTIIYLAIFNRGSRRSLHDLVAGSYVVRTTSAVAVPAPPIWRGHLVIVALIVVLAAAAPYAAKQLATAEVFAGVMPVQEAMSAEEGVITAATQFGLSYGSGGNSDYVSVVLKIDSRLVDDEERARRIARKILEAHPPAGERDWIAVTFVYGYDMVIASGHRSQSFQFEPDELVGGKQTRKL